MLRASAEAEKAGIPSVTLVGSAFMKQAAFVAKGIGMPFAIAEYPGAPMVDSDEEIRAKVEKHLLPAIIEGLTSGTKAQSLEQEREPEPGSIAFEGRSATCRSISDEALERWFPSSRHTRTRRCVS